MENVTEHSKAKLALAVFTSPAPAFEEISRRKLLGTGLAIMAVTGAVAMAAPLISAAGGDRIQWLQLGKANPATWIGLAMLYAFALQKLLKWVGSQVDYVPLLTLMGWSQLALLIMQFGMCGMLYSQASGLEDQTLTRISIPIVVLFSLWYVALIGNAVRSLAGAPLARGILSYIVIEIAAVIGFTWTYGQQRMSGFLGTLTGVKEAAGSVAAADQLPWAGAAVIGLVLGLVQIGKHFEWPAGTIKVRAASAGLIGLAVFGAYALGMSQADYYGKLGRARNAYMRGDYAAAAKGFEGIRRQIKGTMESRLDLTLDIADTYYLAGDPAQALRNYGQARDLVKTYTGKGTEYAIARISVGEGAVYDWQKKYPEAIDKFTKAAKLWPDFREPWNRMAVTYDRMGNYDKAIESAMHAQRILDSDAVVGWIALAEASANKGDTKQAKAAIAIVTDRDKKLAARMGKTMDDWKSAVSKLTREDLRFPLEPQFAKPPAKEQPKSARSQEKSKKESR